MALPSTIANSIALAKVTSYLASNNIFKGALFPTVIRTEPRYPLMITTERIIIEKINDANSSYDNLEEAAYYLRDLCGKYINQAQAIINGGSTGQAGSTTVGGTATFPLYIKSSQFTTATFYPNTNIYGNNILIFLNEINRYLLYDEFSVSASGITISLSGFDALNNDYNMVIEKVYNN